MTYISLTKSNHNQICILKTQIIIISITIIKQIMISIILTTFYQTTKKCKSLNDYELKQNEVTKLIEDNIVASRIRNN